MSGRSTARERPAFLADFVMREASHLQQTDARLFGPGFGIEQARALGGGAGDLGRSERFGRIRSASDWAE